MSRSSWRSRRCGVCLARTCGRRRSPRRCRASCERWCRRSTSTTAGTPSSARFTRCVTDPQHLRGDPQTVSPVQVAILQAVSSVKLALQLGHSRAPLQQSSARLRSPIRPSCCMLLLSLSLTWRDDVLTHDSLHVRRFMLWRGSSWPSPTPCGCWRISGWCPPHGCCSPRHEDRR